MTEKKFAIRFAVEDMEKVRTALKGMGADGASALSALERASRGATPGLKAVDSAARDLRQEFDNFAGRVPVIGGMLQSLGPGGIAAGAGLAAVTLGLGAMATAARQAIDEMGALQDAAENVQLSVENLQSVRAQGMLLGIDASTVDGVLQTFAKNAALGTEELGKMHKVLERVNPELANQLRLASSMADRFDIVARAIQQATTQEDKLNIATAAFGNEGGKMVRMLDQGGASLATFEEAARSAGLVIDGDLVARIDAVGDRLGVMDAKIKAAQTQAALGFAPMIEWFKGIEVAAYEAAAAVGETTKALDDQADWFLKQKIADGRRAMKSAPSYIADAIGVDVAAAEAELARRAKARTEAEAQQAQRARIAEFANWFNDKYRPPAVDDGTSGRSETAAQDASRRAAADAAKAAADVARQRAQEVAAVTARWTSVLESAETPIEKARRALATFDDEVARHGDLVGVNEDAVRGSLVAAIEEAERAANEASPAMRSLGRAMEETAEAQRGVTFEMRFAAETLDSILSENMNSLEDLGSVALRVFKQMAIDWIRENQKMAASQSLFEFIGNAFTSGFGGGGGGAGSNAAQAQASAGAGWGIYHAGTGFVGAGSAPMRTLPASFSGVPRFHSGLAPDEMPAVLQRGERVLSVVHNERLVQAVENGGAAKVELHFHGEMGGQPEVSQKQQADGSMRVDIRIRKAVAEAAGAGALDGVMAERYGVKRGVGR